MRHLVTSLIMKLLAQVNISSNLITEAVARRCSVEKGVLKNFAKFTGKHLCQSLVFNKVAGLSLIKKEILA